MEEYLIKRLDAFDAKLDSVLQRVEEKIEAHAKDDRDNFARIDERMYEQNATISGLKVKSGIFGVSGGLLAGILVYLKSHF